MVSFEIFNQKEILKQENATQMKLDCKFQVNELVMKSSLSVNFFSTHLNLFYPFLVTVFRPI